MREGCATARSSSPTGRTRRWIPFWVVQAIEIAIAVVFVDVSIHVSTGRSPGRRALASSPSPSRPTVPSGSPGSVASRSTWCWRGGRRRGCASPRCSRRCDRTSRASSSSGSGLSGCSGSACSPRPHRLRPGPARHGATPGVRRSSTPRPPWPMPTPPVLRPTAHAGPQPRTPTDPPPTTPPPAGWAATSGRRPRRQAGGRPIRPAARAAGQEDHPGGRTTDRGPCCPLPPNQGRPPGTP